VASPVFPGSVPARPRGYEIMGVPVSAQQLRETAAGSESFRPASQGKMKDFHRLFFSGKGSPTGSRVAAYQLRLIMPA